MHSVTYRCVPHVEKHVENASRLRKMCTERRKLGSVKNRGGVQRSVENRGASCTVTYHTSKNASKTCMEYRKLWSVKTAECQKLQRSVENRGASCTVAYVRKTLKCLNCLDGLNNAYSMLKQAKLSKQLFLHLAK